MRCSYPQRLLTLTCPCGPKPKQDAKQFFAMVPAFVAALPPSLRHEPGTAHSGDRQLEDLDRVSRDNRITFLRFEVQELFRVFTKHRSEYNLSSDTFRTASDTLEQVLYILEKLANNAI